MLKHSRGDEGIRTPDPLLARQVLSQLSYAPRDYGLKWTFPPSEHLSRIAHTLYYNMGLSGLEPPTSRLSGVRSNRLSYKPMFFFFKARSHLLSHIVSNTVPSAAQVLTVVFGMGTGVSPVRIATGNIKFSSVLHHCLVCQPRVLRTLGHSKLANTSARLLPL